MEMARNQPQSRAPTTATAPGKLILCGEHAVVYGYPAIAVPVHGVIATASVQTVDGAGATIEAPDVGERWRIASQPDHPLSHLTSLTLRQLSQPPDLPLLITLRSTIPIASGMGSGAALGAALVKALSLHLGRPLPPAAVSDLVYESERVFHGTPSGIDNTVVSLQQPIWYRRTADRTTIEPVQIGAPLHFVVADTGVRCSTKITVGRVRQGWQEDAVRYERHFARIGQIVTALRHALAAGSIPSIGPLLDQNHAELQAIGVSSFELDTLVQAARDSGALGAKLSGGGGGGVMLALVEPRTHDRVAAALRAAGAVRVLPAPLTASH